MFISMKFRNSLKIVVLSVSFCIAAIVPTFAATQDVRVTNWPTSYSVVNTTWDSRLSTLQTTLQSLAADMSQFPTFVSRFGWNGTLSFSQGFETLYNTVSSSDATLSAINSSLTNINTSSLLSAFNREWPEGWNAASSGSSSKFYLRSIQRYVGGLETTPWGTNIAHIDSDIHTLNSTASSMDSSLDSIDSNTSSIYNLTNNHLPLIRVNTDNIAADTEDINTYTSNLPSINSNVSTLQEFFADADSQRHKAAAQDASNEALDTFTGSGSSAASATTYSDINVFSSGVTDSFQTGVSGSQAISYLSNGSNVMGWFSVDTYNAFHTGESSSNSNSRSLRSESSYPLLEQYYSDVFSVVGVE